MGRYEFVNKFDSDVFGALCSEEKRLFEGVNLIPSENYTYPEVLECLGSTLTDKYSEGYPGKRYYGGNANADIIEKLAVERAKSLFHAEHVNVQPLSGSPMNQAVYFAFLKPGDTVLGMDLSHGGHLTHGAPVSHMGNLFNFIRYKTDPEHQGRIDFDEIMSLAKKHRPKIILCGYTSYPRDYDYKDFYKVAQAIDAITMADIAHIGGFVAAGEMTNPLDCGFDIVTTTTHKSLRGPRGGMIMCKEKYAKIIDKSVFPGLQGGPHMNNIAGIAVTLKKAMQPEFKSRAKQVMKNAKVLAKRLMDLGVKLVTDGTDNHMMVIDTIESFGIDGAVAELALEKANIYVNKQIIPDDVNPAMKPSGIRVGTPAVTTRGCDENDMQKIAEFIVEALKNFDNDDKLNEIGGQVLKYFQEFPVPSIV